MTQHEVVPRGDFDISCVDGRRYSQVIFVPFFAIGSSPIVICFGYCLKGEYIFTTHLQGIYTPWQFMECKCPRGGVKFCLTFVSSELVQNYDSFQGL